MSDNEIGIGSFGPPDTDDETQHQAYLDQHADCEECAFVVCLAGPNCPCGEREGERTDSATRFLCADVMLCKKTQGRAVPGGFVVRPSADGVALVDLLVEVLSVRAGETLTPGVIRERAANAATMLMVTYKMERL